MRTLRNDPNLCEAEAPFFIVGNSRSGTTLVSRILTRHPDIFVLNETHFMEQFRCKMSHFRRLDKDDLWRLINKMLTIQDKGYFRKSEYDEYPDDAQQILTAFQQQGGKDFATLNRVFFEFEAKRHGKRRAGDQTPRHVFYIYELVEMYPNAKFIHMIRDPRAILFSQKHKWKAALRRGQPSFEVLRAFINYHPITTAIIWKKAIEAGLKAQRTVPKKSMKTVFFERLVGNPTEEIQQLCDFLQIKFSPDMINVSVEMSAHITDEGYKGISKSVSERWNTQLSETEIFLAEKLVDYQMQSLGYSPTGAEPSLLNLLFWILIWPLQIATAFTLSLGRMGNPLNYISKRFFPKSKASFGKAQAFKK